MISVLHGGITTADWLRQLPHRTASLEEAGRVHGPSASLRPQALPSALPAAADGRCLPLMVTVWLQEHQPTLWQLSLYIGRLGLVMMKN